MMSDPYGLRMRIVFLMVKRARSVQPRSFLVGAMWLLLSLLVSFTSAAQEVDSGNLKASLIADSLQVASGASFTVLLKQDIREDWHTYWRNPGDSGAPTKLIWTLPDGVTASELAWPIPEKIPYGPLMNFGYHGEVYYPVTITIDERFDAASLDLAAVGQWLVCADICVPEQARLSLTIPLGTQPQLKPDQSLFRAAAAQVPSKWQEQGSVTVRDEIYNLFVPIPGLKTSRVTSISYFPFAEGLIDTPVEQNWRVTDKGFNLESKTGYAYQAKADFSGLIVIEEAVGDGLRTGFEVTVNAVSASGQTAVVDNDNDNDIGNDNAFSLWQAILFAFIGGMILNLMPCVFPVLSIKILSLVQESHHIRAHGWFYALGVVLSFVLVAGLLIVLRTGGAEIGWGFQLQSPWVVTVLAWLFLLIGLNLSGFFEVGYAMMGFGQGATEKQGYSSSFLTGVLATIVAAPCTAPFMASAIGFALTQNNASALLIFASLGLGMALPYLMLCYFPAFVARLPKPGEWMVTTKEILAFPMYASAVWLVWVLSIQAGSGGVLIVGVGAVCLVLAIWILRHLPKSPPGRLSMQVLALLLIVLTGYIPSHTSTLQASAETTIRSSTTGMAATEVDSQSIQQAAYSGPIAEKYSAAALQQRLAQGPVFVNFTAAWCITCKVNEVVALDSAATKSVFDAAGVSYLKGDWTNEDPEISRKLTEHGRSGVPLYLLYRKGAREPIVLPQLLTEDIVQSAIAEL